MDVSALPAWGSAFFSSGMASPVSVDWLIKRSFAEISRMSAGIMSPADSSTMSPGTTWPIADIAVPRSAVLPAHGRFGLNHAPQRICRLGRAMLLKETERDAEQDHDCDDDRRPLVAEQIGHCSECQQKHVERVDGAADDFNEDRVAGLVSHFVRTH